jgi:uncharacterized membrane protein
MKMTLTPNQISMIAFIITAIIAVCGFMKLLRSNKVLIILLTITFPIAIFGLIIRGVNTEMVNGNAADMLLSPFIYVASYALLRLVFKRIYKMEPTYERYSWYSDGRKQNWLDVIVHVIPLMLSFTLPFLIENILDKYA